MNGTEKESPPTLADELEKVPPADAEEKETLLGKAVENANGIVLILPGLTGDSTQNYVTGLVQVAAGHDLVYILT